MDPAFTFVTTYGKEYVKKPIKRTPINSFRQEFDNLVTEGFKRYLVLDNPDVQTPKEDADLYLNKFKEQNKDLGPRHFPNPLDKNVIMMADISDKATEYQVKYCDLLKDMEYAKELLTKQIKLPDDIVIPESTHNFYFRDPQVISPGLVSKPEMILPRNHLGASDKFSQMTKMKPANSYYMDTIGKLGEFIITEQLHGKISHPPCTCTLHHPTKQN